VAATVGEEAAVVAVAVVVAVAAVEVHTTKPSMVVVAVCVAVGVLAAARQLLAASLSTNHLLRAAQRGPIRSSSTCCTVSTGNHTLRTKTCMVAGRLMRSL